MSYKARHAAEPKYIAYARSTGASIAAMAVLTAVPAVAVESDAPLGAVGEAAPIAEPAVGAHADTAAADLLDSPAAPSGQDGAAGDTNASTRDGDGSDLMREVSDLARQFGAAARAPQTLPGDIATAAGSETITRDLTLGQGESTTIDVAESHPDAGSAVFTFDNPHNADGVHVKVDGTNITVSVDKDATPGAYVITGSASGTDMQQKAQINLTVTESTANPATPAPSSAKTVELTAVAGGEFVTATTLASAAGSTLTVVTSTLPAGVQRGDFGGSPTFEAAPGAEPGTYPITVTETLADGTAIEHTVNLTIEAPGTTETPSNPDPETPPAVANLAWAAGTNVVQGSTSTAAFTGTHGAAKPMRYDTVAVYAENGAQMDRGTVTVDPETGTATIAPSWELAPGTYTATISGVYADGSSKSGQLTFTVTAGKLSDRYTPTVGQAYIGTNPDRVVRSKVNYGNTEAPLGVTYTWDDENNVVEVNTDGTVVFQPNPTLEPGTYTATITVHYPTADGAEADTDAVPVIYNVGDTFMSLDYTLVTDKHTVARRDSVTIGVPHDVNGKPLPDKLTLERGRDWPEWVMLNGDGTLTASPNLNVKPGTYVFTSLATFPDDSTGEVTNTIEVSAAYKTQGFKYKRKDGLGAKVGRAIDQALGTEKPGSADPQQVGQPDQPGEQSGGGTAPDTAAAGSGGDTETAGNTAATPTDNMVAAPAVVAVNDTAPAGTRGAAALQTTGADSDGLIGAGAAAGGFALAAAAAFALRRREQDGAI